MQRPGAYHNARFMAHCIYLIKIYMLHTFSMNSRDSACVQRMTKFVACLYGRYFLQSPLTTSAAANDLEFWKDLTEYAEIDSTIADASKKSVTRHMWYLVPEMITLALFNRKLPTNQKKEITEALLNFPRSSSFDAGKPNLLHPLQIRLPPVGFLMHQRWCLFY